MVVARGSRLLLIGMGSGLLGSVERRPLSRAAGLERAAFDPLAFAMVSMLLLAAGLQACFWPARRAARTDPLIALRQD